jgi:hypothetical protein
MQKLRELLFASTVASLVCSGGAQALPLNIHTPTTHVNLNPQPLPPIRKAGGTQSNPCKTCAAVDYFQKPDGSKGAK